MPRARKPSVCLWVWMFPRFPQGSPPCAFPLHTPTQPSSGFIPRNKGSVSNPDLPWVQTCTCSSLAALKFLQGQEQAALLPALLLHWPPIHMAHRSLDASRTAHTK